MLRSTRLSHCLGGSLRPSGSSATSEPQPEGTVPSSAAGRLPGSVLTLEDL